MIRFIPVTLGMFVVISTPALAQSTPLADFNQSLPKNGVVFDNYAPSFYTGFAPRVEAPERIHFRIARGNQARLTAILDEQAVLTYLYQLKKRKSVYDEVVGQRIIEPLYLDQLSRFNSVVSSPVYGIEDTLRRYSTGALSREALYEKSLQVMEALNPGRVFRLKLDLDARFAAAANLAQALLGNATLVDARSALSWIQQNPKDSLVVANEVLPGRLNLISLTESRKALLAEFLLASNHRVDSRTLRPIALALLLDASEGLFDFKTVREGRRVDALQCQSEGPCVLAYPEFTAIYPVGTVASYTSDSYGNQIPVIRTTGVWNFLQRNYHEVDHIREETYYGFMPKMDYEAIGNGIHNPAVRKNLKSSNFSNLVHELEIPGSYTYLWAVSRGGVSSGCVRMAGGHIWEVRHVFPSNPESMPRLRYHGNSSADYDLFDVDGDGRLEVMGVEYFIAYSLSGLSGEAKREGSALAGSSLNREQFYNVLYGRNEQFRVTPDGGYKFLNPSVSYFLGTASGEMKAAPFSRRVPGEYPLYEQAYEREKIQFYMIRNSSLAMLASPRSDHQNRHQQLVRALGRINGCGPWVTEFASCSSEARFDQEISNLKRGFLP